MRRRVCCDETEYDTLSVIRNEALGVRNEQDTP
jgi:hypothetical protein